MANRQKKRKSTPWPRDWNMVSLITRSGGKGWHQSKKHKPRTTDKQAFRKSLMDDRSFHGAFFMVEVCVLANPVIDPVGLDRSSMFLHDFQ